MSARADTDVLKDVKYTTIPSSDKDTPRKKPEAKKPLSCQGCRLRKVKCNIAEANPCSNCVRLSLECVQFSSDMRTKRPRATYVQSLEKQIKDITAFFDDLEALQTPEQKVLYISSRAGFLQSWSQGQSSATSESQSPIINFPVPESTALPRNLPPDSAQSARMATSLAYTPTSVYQNHFDPQNAGTNGPNASVNAQNGLEEKRMLQKLAKDPEVLLCLRLFFTWQYPNHNMFVFRESFFTDFFSPNPNSLYCSSVLVLSLCSLGSRMAKDDKIYRNSIEYYRTARNALLQDFENPSITSVQSYLLLAFYDICNGHYSTGWMLSGNAIRMGYDLGFQLNPEVWFLKSSSEKIKDLDVSIRSRIYWGCFMADHFISLVLGKPSLLKGSDATIPDSEDLPELDWINEYKYIPQYPKGTEKAIPDTNISVPLKYLINLIKISDNMLNDVFTNDSNKHDDYDLSSRLSKLFEYNAQIMDWKNNLPSEINWDRQNLELTSDNPTISSVRFYFYILLLCLNRPFVGFHDSELGRKNPHLFPATMCSNVIDDLVIAISKFQSVHGLRYASIFVVYCSILSISVILLTSTSLDAIGQNRLKFFLNVLSECSRTWGLAEKSHKMIEKKLQNQYAEFRHTEAPSPVKGHAGVKTEMLETAAVKAERLDTVQLLGDLPNNANLSDSLPSAHLSDPAGVAEFDQSTYEFFGGPPVLMTSNLVNEDWEALFPDSIFSHRFDQSPEL